MNTIQIGTSALNTSRLAYGCWRIAGSSEAGEASPDQQEKGFRAVVAAYEAGYSLFDHADVYGDGLAEQLFGRVLKEVPGMREKIIVATKCGIRKAGEPSPDSPYRYDFSSSHIIKSCDQSLQRLGIEMIDLYQLHRPDLLGDPAEIADAFSKLKSAGKVREFGVSNFSAIQIVALQKACPMRLIANQVEISLLKTDCLTDGTLDHCVTEKITPMAWSPLGAGRLATGGPITLHTADHAKRLKLREILDGIGRQHNTNRSVVALAWLLAHPAKIVPIIGSTDVDHIRESVEASSLELTREDWYRLLEAAFGKRLA